MADLNLRGIDERTMQQIAMAAARRGGKGGKRSWAIQVLAAAAREELGGRPPYPKLRLCARCVRANESLAKAPVPEMCSIGSEILVSEATAANPFEHLLAESTPTELPAPVEFPPVIAEPLQTSAVEVAPGLFVGSDKYREDAQGSGWSILAASKEPWHRQMVGYETKSAPEGQERLVARRGNAMALNFIDVEKLGPGGATYVPEEVIRAGIRFIDERLTAGDKVLVHCNHGRAQAPSIALLYMRQHGLLPWRMEDAVTRFRDIYPEFAPGAGLRAYLEALTNDADEVMAS